jgi:hypothetical protein
MPAAVYEVMGQELMRLSNEVIGLRDNITRLDEENHNLRLRLAHRDESVPPVAGPFSDPKTGEHAMKEGWVQGKIPAIKRLRERHGVGLKTAKDWVEMHATMRTLPTFTEILGGELTTLSEPRILDYYWIG